MWEYIIVLVLVVFWFWPKIKSLHICAPGCGEHICGGNDQGCHCAGNETFIPCNDCDQRMPRNGISVLNPFVWPYSGAQSIDNLYSLGRSSGVDFGFNAPAPTHLSTPDHALLTR